jgi:hypothetical protein
LEQYAVKTGKLLKGGEADINAAAKMILHDWQRGRIPYFVCPEFDTEAPSKSATTTTSSTEQEDDDAARQVCATSLLLSSLLSLCVVPISTNCRPWCIAIDSGFDPPTPEQNPCQSSI